MDFTLEQSEAIKAFLKDRVVGWLTLNGLYECDLYDHYRFFEKHPTLFPKVTEMLSQFHEDEQQAASEWIDSIPEGEHPEWHIHEMYWSDKKYDLQKEIRTFLYANRWARIGTFSKGGSKMIEVETSQNTQYVLWKKAEMIAELLDRELVWNIV